MDSVASPRPAAHLAVDHSLAGWRGICEHIICQKLDSSPLRATLLAPPFLHSGRGRLLFLAGRLMPLPAGGELAHRMVDRLYVAKTSKEAHLCKVALRSLVEADIKCSAFAEQAEEPILKRWSRNHKCNFVCMTYCRLLLIGLFV